MLNAERETLNAERRTLNAKCRHRTANAKKSGRRLIALSFLRLALATVHEYTCAIAAKIPNADFP
jgi:hypothetical protein